MLHVAAAESAAASKSRSRGFMGHPRGLAYIVFTEGWERFSFHGMQALLILYLAGYLLHPGHVEAVWGFAQFRAALESVFGNLSVQALASQIFGLYIGLVYFFPMIGGSIGDRIMGRTRAVVAGAVLMAIGHFLMAIEQALLYALLSLILGAGLMKGNLAAQVGRLYALSDPRRDSAFSLYCLAINAGAFLAPLVCGTLGEVYGWHYGFGAAGIGMLIATGVYIAGRRHLPEDEIRTEAREPSRLQPGDWRIIAALSALIAITALYWTAQTQVWNVYPLWLKDRVDRDLMGFAVPVTWFQSFDTLAVLVMGPILLWLWRRKASAIGAPDELGRVAFGCIAFMASCLLLAVGELEAGGDRLGLLVPAVFHFLGALGYLYVWPITLSIVSRAAPASVNAMMLGASYLAIFVGGVLSGWLGRFYERIPPSRFWLLHALIALLGAVLVWLVGRALLGAVRMRGVHPTAEASVA